MLADFNIDNSNLPLTRNFSSCLDGLKFHQYIRDKGYTLDLICCFGLILTNCSVDLLYKTDHFLVSFNISLSLISFLHCFLQWVCSFPFVENWSTYSQKRCANPTFFSIRNAFPFILHATHSSSNLPFQFQSFLVSCVYIWVLFLDPSSSPFTCYSLVMFNGWHPAGFIHQTKLYSLSLLPYYLSLWNPTLVHFWLIKLW